MRKLLFLAAALVSLAACDSGNKYTVKGTIAGDNEALVNGKAYLFIMVCVRPPVTVASENAVSLALIVNISFSRNMDSIPGIPSTVMI